MQGYQKITHQLLNSLNMLQIDLHGDIQRSNRGWFNHFIIPTFVRQYFGELFLGQSIQVSFQGRTLVRDVAWYSLRKRWSHSEGGCCWSDIV